MESRNQVRPKTWRDYFQHWQLSNFKDSCDTMLDTIESIYPLASFKNSSSFPILEAWIADAYIKGLLSMSERQRLINEIQFVADLSPP